MKTKNFFQISCYFLFFLQSALPAAQNDQKLAWIEGHYFEIIGTDTRSVSFTNTLGEHIVEILKPCLSVGSHEFPQPVVPVVVVLQSAENIEFEEEYQIKSDARGQVRLELNWCESLTLETLTRALTEAYLVRYATFNYGPGADQKIKFWAVSALASWSYLNLRPAQKAAYFFEAREHGVSDIGSLLRVDFGSVSGDKHLLRQGYWVLYTLLDHELEYTNISVLLEQAVMGVDVTNEFKAMAELNASEKGPDFVLEDWWQRQINTMLLQDYEYCDSLTISQKWIEGLADLDGCSNSDAKLESLMDLWKYRDDETMRSVLEARCEMIRFRLERINPAYFNAALSLGVLYETTLKSEQKYAFIRALSAYLTDWADTKQLHEKTFKLLSENIR